MKCEFISSNKKNLINYNMCIRDGEAFSTSVNFEVQKTIYLGI